MKLLVFNVGSSSLKFELFEVLSLRGGRRPTKLAGALERHPEQAARDLLFRSARNDIQSLHKGQFDNHGKPIRDFHKAVSDALRELDVKNIGAIGHRVVHGGERYTAPTKITPAVITEIKKLSRLAPLHNPPNLAVILACKKLFPGVPQVAVFDTAFHHTMPEKAFLYGLPYSLYKKFGIRRYGFHGISHQYVFEVARKKLGRSKTRRTVTCHLGNGCSIAAILDGRVIDTSMGFTPLEGIPMGTRSGDLDPAIIFYLIRNGFSAGEVEEILNKKSGLLGVSEVSSDMRDLFAASKKGGAKGKAANRTLEFFAYRIAKYIGSYSAALGGLDCIVFTGGIGEHAFYLRSRILKYLAQFRKKRVLVIPTHEEKKIAEEARTLLRKSR